MDSTCTSMSPNVCKPAFSYFIQVIRHFDGCKADLVVCDGAPDGKENAQLNFIIMFICSLGNLVSFYVVL